MKRLLFLVLLLLPTIGAAQGFGGNAPKWLTLWTESGGTLTLSGNLVATNVSATSYTATAASGNIAVQTLTGAKTCLGTGGAGCITWTGSTHSFTGGITTAGTVNADTHYGTGTPKTMSFRSYEASDGAGEGFKFDTSLLDTEGDQHTVWKNNTVKIGALDRRGLLQISFGNTAALPTCDATTRNTIGVIEGGAGVTDTVYICLKAVADTYSWIVLATGG
jgi:hypothetical protein